MLNNSEKDFSNLLWNVYYTILPEPKVLGWVPAHYPWVQAHIKDELKENGFKVVDFFIDINDYKKYLKEAKYHKFKHYYKGGKAPNFIEKSLEHYIAAKLLELNAEDVYIDVATGNSPAPEIYHKIYGCKVFKQDLIFPPGIRRNTIGGNAANMPIEDGFATKMALHCSFEHFEGDSDIGFLKEANRVLRKGGKLCIVPLYLFNKYAIQTDPACLIKNGIISFEKDAILYCANGWGARHGRFYDIPHLISRIKNNLGDLNLTIYVVQNEKEIDPSCYVKFVALLLK